MFDPVAVKCPSDLPAPLPAIVERQGIINLRARQPLCYSFHWLRETGMGAIEGEFGSKVNAGGEVEASIVIKAAWRQEISLDERGWLRVRVFKSRNSSFDCPEQIQATAQAATALPRQPDELVAAIVRVHEKKSAPNAPRIIGAGGDRLLASLLRLRDSIFQQAVGVVEKKNAARVSWQYTSAAAETALVDCCFAFTDEGLLAYRRAIAGDYSWIPDADAAHVDVREGVLTTGLRSEMSMELHLPFLGRREWKLRAEALARAEVSSDADGRLLVYHVPAAQRVLRRNSYQGVLSVMGGLPAGRVHTDAGFTLSYSDQRRLPCARAARSLLPVLRAYGFAPGAAHWLESLASRMGELDVSWSLTIPGSSAGAWLDAPGERDPDFFAVYSRVSVAVQRALRLWLPDIYFADAARYDTLESALPLVVYQASRPFGGKPRFDLTYDVLEEQSMRGFFRMAEQVLPAELAAVQARLVREGRTRTAARYNPRQAGRILGCVQRSPRLLNSLLAADAFLVDSLVHLGCRGSQLRLDSGEAPAELVTGLPRIAAEVVKALNSKLRRLYVGREFLNLAGLLLVEATNALSTTSGKPSGIQACLRVSQGPAGDPEAIRQTLVNQQHIA